MLLHETKFNFLNDNDIMSITLSDNTGVIPCVQLTWQAHSVVSIQKNNTR